MSYQDGRFKVIRNAFDYSVIDSWQKNKLIKQFAGKTSKERAWGYANKLNKESPQNEK